MNIIPTIEKDGSVGEVSGTDDTGVYFIRTVGSDPDDIFKYETIYFKVANKIAITKILIHTKFKQEISNNKKRTKAIQQHLNKLAPWLFTYGKRVEQ